MNLNDLSSRQQILISSSLPPLICYLQETLLALENIGQHKHHELGTSAPIVLIPMSYHLHFDHYDVGCCYLNQHMLKLYLHVKIKNNCKTPHNLYIYCTIIPHIYITTANMSCHTTDWESVGPQLLAGWWYRTWSDGRYNLHDRSTIQCGHESRAERKRIAAILESELLTKTSPVWPYGNKQKVTNLTKSLHETESNQIK